MLKIEYPEVAYPKKTIARAARNPMNSWALSDTTDEEFGPKDLMLMNSLARAGSDHAKYRRMMIVYLDIIAPLYWWKQFDTYKVGSVRVSCSTMHKIAAKEFTIDDFSLDRIPNKDIDLPNCLLNTYHDGIKCVIEALNAARSSFLKTGAEDYWYFLIQGNLDSYNVRATVMLNYEHLAKMHRERRNHKLDEWHDFCDWIKELPYSELIILEEE